MPSRQHQNHSEIIFFLLAIVIIIGGYATIVSNDTLEGAAVAKTGKTYTAPAKEAPSNNTSSSSSSSTASYQPNQSNMYIQNPNPTFYSSNTSTTASNQTTTESLNTSSAQPSSQNETAMQVENSTIHNSSEVQDQTMTNGTATGKKTLAKLSAAAPTAPSLIITTAEIKSDSITLMINNPTSTALLVEPALEEISALPIPNEKRVKELLAEELERESKDATPQNIEHEWQILHLLEKENIQPIYTTKVFHPWDFMTANAITSLTYTGKRSSGQFLELQAPKSFTVPALQQTRQVIRFPSAVSAVGRHVKLKLMVEGKEKYETNFTIPASFSAAVSVDKKNHLLDIYLSIPQTTDTAMHEYLIEMQVKNNQKTAYYELFGPYQVAGSESALFSQEFKYDSRIVQGKETVVLTIFKDGREVKKIEQEEDFDEGKI